MSGRLEGKTAIVVGGGQTPGATIGNGRATSILFAREGARVLVVDRDLDSAKETKAMIDAKAEPPKSTRPTYVVQPIASRSRIAASNSTVRLISCTTMSASAAATQGPHA